MLNKEFYYLCLSGRKSCAEKKNPVSAILRDGIIEGCMFCLGLILFLNPRLSAGVIDFVFNLFRKFRRQVHIHPCLHKLRRGGSHIDLPPLLCFVI